MRIYMFVCLPTGVVPLELVASPSTVAFAACLNIFERYLREILDFFNVNNVDIGTALSRRGVQWTFRLRGRPHWGGIF